MSRTVLITRQPADCVGLSERLTPCGITLFPYPVLRLEDVDDHAAWVELIDRIGTRDGNLWLVMASPRAPERFAALCRKHDAGWLLGIPVAVIGEGTAEASAAVGLEPIVIGPGTGAGLAEELTRRLSETSTVVFACGHHRREELPEALEAAGHTVVPLIVYRMDATPSGDLPTLGGTPDAVVVTSPRAARLYLDGVGGSPLSCPHWALGPTTRDAAAGIGIDCLIPPEPNLESLAEVLCRI